MPAVQHLRRLVLPARRLLPEAVLIDPSMGVRKSRRTIAQPPQGDGDPAFAGNAVCACLDGSVVHAHGEGLGEVALRSVNRGDGARVAIWRLPDRARVRQLVVAEPPGGRSALVAARLSCAVHFAAAATEGGASGGRALREVAHTRFHARAHHVSMSPCIRGEAAVVVAAGGGLQVLRLERASSSSSSCGASSSASAAGRAGAAAPLQSVVLPWQTDGHTEADGCWAGAEYAEHPRCCLPVLHESLHPLTVREYTRSRHMPPTPFLGTPSTRAASTSHMAQGCGERTCAPPPPPLACSSSTPCTMRTAKNSTDRCWWRRTGWAASPCLAAAWQARSCAA